jgi:hypothetical protein
MGNPVAQQWRRVPFVMIDYENTNDILKDMNKGVV